MAPPPYHSGRKYDRDEDDYDLEGNGARRNNRSKKLKSEEGTALPVPDRDRDQAQDRQKSSKTSKMQKLASQKWPRSGRPKTDTLSVKDRIESEPTC
jgi:hypothetical protein